MPSWSAVKGGDGGDAGGEGDVTNGLAWSKASSMRACTCAAPADRYSILASTAVPMASFRRSFAASATP
eukprot:scaffold303139_cov31-Tisochrysis_lutea.AAC.2